MSLNPAQTRLLIWSALSAAALLALWLLSPVLTPFAVAAVLAYVLVPLVDRMAAGAGRVRLPRWLAVVVVELLFALALVSVLLLLVPILARELPLLREQIPALAARFDAVVSPWLAQFGIEVALDAASVKAWALKYLNANWSDSAWALLASARIGGSLLLTVAGNLVLIPLVLFYLLLDWHGLMRRTAALVPPRLAPAVGRFAADCNLILGQYLRGQLLVLAILAVFFTTALWLVGLDLALPVGVFTGLAFFVPYLGFGLGLLLATMSALLQFGSVGGVLAVWAVYALGQILESALLTPRLVGESIGLHPLAVIFALLAFGQLLGLVGILLALPISAVLVVALRRLKTAYLASSLYRG
jgi:predicted PurR-regulated permease PerM